MPALGFPREVQLDAFLNGWRDVTSELRETRPINVSYAQSAEQVGAAASYFTATLDNDSGNWTQENPLGAYYGLWGPQTPMRLCLKVSQDTFDDRTVGSGWGTSSSGDVWTPSGSTPTSVSGGKGHWSFASSVIASMVGPAIPLKDMYVKYDYTPTISDITGASFETGVLLRYVNNLNFYYARVVVDNVDDLYRLQVWRFRNGVFTGVSVDQPTVGLTHTAGATVSIAAAIEDRTVLMKAWDATLPEPLDWQQIEVDGDIANGIDDPGTWAIRAGFSSSNTNVKPVVVDIDNVDVRVILSSGFAEGDDTADLSHADRNTQVRVSGHMKRVMDAKAPVKSALRRVYENDTTGHTKAYWSAEDGELSTGISPSIQIPGLGPMTLQGQPSFRANTDFEASAALPTMGNSAWIGSIPTYTNTGESMTRWLMAVPAGGTTNGAAMFRLEFSGATLGFLDIEYATGGSVMFRGYSDTRVLIHSAGPVGYGLDGNPKQVQLDVRQVGANVEYTFTELVPGATSGGTFTGVIAGRTMGASPRLMFGVTRNIDSVSIGHILHRDQIVSIYTQATELNAFYGEDHLTRFIRLCDQNNIPVAWYGALNSGTAMGYQRPETLATLFDQVRAVDQGFFCDMRVTPGLRYRNRATIEAQVSPRLTLDYGAGQVSEPFRPATSDLQPRNDVRGTRIEGGEYRFTKTSGSKNINLPGNDPDGVGRYDFDLPLNVRDETVLEGIVQLDVAMATSKARRWPEVTADLAAPENASAAQQAAILGITQGDRISVPNATLIHQYQAIDLLCLGYSMTISNGMFLHRVTFNTDRYEAWRALTMELGGYDRLDTNDSVTNEVVDIGETDIDVLSPSAAWITTALYPTHFPVDIEIGGEVMSLTSATSLGGNVYRLTVTRTLAKQHPIGKPVRLAYASTGFLARR